MNVVLRAIPALIVRMLRHETFLFGKLLRERFGPPALRAWAVHILLGRGQSLGRSLGGGCDFMSDFAVGDYNKVRANFFVASTHIVFVAFFFFVFSPFKPF